MNDPAGLAAVLLIGWCLMGLTGLLCAWLYDNLRPRLVQALLARLAGAVSRTERRAPSMPSEAVPLE